MAKRRKKRGSSRRRVGAMAMSASSPIVQIGSLALGYFLAADPINGLIDGFASKISPAPGSTAVPASTVPASTNKIIAAVETLGGGYLLMSKKKRSMIKTVAGGVIAGAGLKRALKAFNVISGFQNIPVVGRLGNTVVKRPKGLMGFRDVPVVAGGAEMYGYTPTGAAALTGYNVGRSVASQIMGSANGSGLRSDGGLLN